MFGQAKRARHYHNVGGDSRMVEGLRLLPLLLLLLLLLQRAALTGIEPAALI